MELKHVFFSSLLLSATFTACTNEEFTTEISAPVTVEDAISLGEGYTIVGSKMGDATSRAVISNDLKSAFWEKTDMIGAAWYNMASYDENGELNESGTGFNDKFASNTWFKWSKQIGNDMSTAEFTSDANAMAGAYVLYYPYNETITSTFDGVPVKIAYNQTMDCTEGKELDFVNENLFAYCVYPFVPGGTQTADFKMKQLANVFKLSFEVKKPDLMILENPVKINKVILEAKKDGESVLFTDGRVNAPKSSDVNYSKGTYGKAEFKGVNKADHLILDVNNATDAYAIKALNTPTEKPFYITALPFPKDGANSFTVKILTEDESGNEKVYFKEITGDALTSLNEIAQKEGQIIDFKVVIEEFSEDNKIYTAEQFKKRWDAALKSDKPEILNIGEGVDLSDMDLNINNNVDITLSGKSAKVKSLSISNGKLTVNNELSVAGDVTIGSNAKGFSTSTDGSIAVDGKVAVQGTANNVKFSKIGSLDIDASGVIAIEGVQNNNSENISEIGTITNEGSLTLNTVSVKTLSNTGTVTLGNENVTNEGTFTNKGTFSMGAYKFDNNGTFSQEGTISGSDEFNNNAGATLDVKKTTSITFINAAATDKLEAAVINVAKNATLSAKATSDNNGIINVTGTLSESANNALTQTDDAARIIAKSEKAVITRKSGGKALEKGYIVIINNDNYPTVINNEPTAYDLTSVENVNIPSDANNIFVNCDVKASQLSSNNILSKNVIFYKNITFLIKKLYLREHLLLLVTLK